MNGTIRAFTMIQPVKRYTVSINVHVGHRVVIVVCRKTPGKPPDNTNVIVTRSRCESRKRETDFLKNCSDLINKKRNKRCLRQLSVVLTLLIHFVRVLHRSIFNCIIVHTRGQRSTKVGLFEYEDTPVFFPQLSLFYRFMSTGINRAVHSDRERRMIDGNELAKFYRNAPPRCRWMNKNKENNERRRQRAGGIGGFYNICER